MKPRTIRFEFWQSFRTKQWYWHIRAKNGEIIAHGESYKRKASIVRVHALICGNRIELVETVERKWKPKHYAGKLNRSWP